MSSLNSFNGTLIIYQAGLGGDERDFRKTIQKLVASNTRRHKAFIIDNDFNASFLDAGNVWQGNGPISSWFPETADLRTQLYKLVQFCNKYPEHHIHVRTQLGGEYGYDSIQKQAACLIAIIDYLRSQSDFRRKIVLVGHSQGGLVNLEAAIARPACISKVISLSTPYSVAAIGQDVMALLHLADLFKKDVDSILSQGGRLPAEETQKYRDRIETLSTPSYFADLKNGWDNCANRPKLYAISGASGLLAHTYRRPSPRGVLAPITLMIAFDGLVTVKEQHDISCDGYQPLVDNDAISRCTRPGNCDNCGTFSCGLPVLNVTDIESNGLRLGIFNFLAGQGFTFDNYVEELFEVITATAYPDYKTGSYLPPENPRPNSAEYSRYYEIYSGRYSHGWIRYDDLAISCIRSYIE